MPVNCLRLTKVLSQMFAGRSGNVGTLLLLSECENPTPLFRDNVRPDIGQKCNYKCVPYGRIFFKRVAIATVQILVCQPTRLLMHPTRWQHTKKKIIVVDNLMNVSDEISMLQTGNEIDENRT